MLCYILVSVSIPGCNQSLQVEKHFLEFGTLLVLMALLDGTCVAVGMLGNMILFPETCHLE